MLADEGDKLGKATACIKYPSAHISVEFVALAVPRRGPGEKPLHARLQLECAACGYPGLSWCLRFFH